MTLVVRTARLFSPEARASTDLLDITRKSGCALGRGDRALNYFEIDPRTPCARISARAYCIPMGHTMTIRGDGGLSAVVTVGPEAVVAEYRWLGDVVEIVVEESVDAVRDGLVALWSAMEVL